LSKAITLQQYTGAALLNARQLNLSMQLITGEQKPAVLSRHNVMELLNVIESLAMSFRVLFDGSIQQQDKEKLIRNNTLYRNLLQPTLLATPEERLLCCEQAAIQSWLLIEQWLASPESWDSEPGIATEEALVFCTTLQEGLGLEGIGLRQYALNVAESMSFLGAKAVAGMLLAIPDEAARMRVQEALLRVTAHSELAGCFAAGIVNRFRVNFVNELAANHHAAYVAAPVIEGLKNQQNMLLWRYLGTKIQGSVQQQHALMNKQPDPYPGADLFVGSGCHFHCADRAVQYRRHAAGRLAGEPLFPQVPAGDHLSAAHSGGSRVHHDADYA